MENNRTFFKNVQKDQMSLKDIFSDVFKKHSQEDTARVFTAGTVLTTPTEDRMLAQWSKPFLFFRFLTIGMLLVLLAFVTARMPFGGLTYAVLLTIIPVLIPVTLLLLTWEMNIPRNISLADLLLYVTAGGILSLTFTMILVQTDLANGSGILDSRYFNSEVAAALTEEPAKLIVVYLILRKKNYPYLLNGILTGVAVGVGFAIFESLGYVWFYGVIQTGSVEYGVTMGLTRAFSAIPGHGGYAALYGFALVSAGEGGRVSGRSLTKPVFLKYLLIAMVLHGVNNWNLPHLFLPPIYIPHEPTFEEPLALEIYPVCICLALIWLPIYLTLLRRGVNEIVGIVTGLGLGVTQAVSLEQEEAYRRSIEAVRPAGWVLTALTGPGRGTSFPIRDGQNVAMGRDPQRSNIVLPQAMVSGLHCRISVANGAVYVTDLASTNGTFLDGQPLSVNQPVPVEEGTVIRLGGAECEFRLEKK